MENLHLEGDFYSPTVDFNADTGTFTIGGNSILSDPVSYYEPLLQWLSTYADEAKAETRMIIELRYCNTSSSRSLMEVFKQMESLHLSGNSKVKIIWKYDPEDEDLQETGENFSEILNLPFEVMAVPMD